VPLFHSTGQTYRSGEIIHPGNWGKVIRQTGEAHGSWKREQVLETVRSAEFAAKPPRLESAYAFLDLPGALWWLHHERKSDHLYVVEVVDEALPQHIGDLLGVEMIAGVDASPEAAARRYWNGGKPTFTTPDGAIIKEFVTASPLKVMQRVQLR
jgi:hypothetical protein